MAEPPKLKPGNKPSAPPLRAALVSLDHDQELTDEVLKAEPELGGERFELMGLDGEELGAAPAPDRLVAGASEIAVADLEIAEPEIAEPEIAEPEIAEIDQPIQIHHAPPSPRPSPDYDPFAAPSLGSMQVELDLARPVVSSFAPPDQIARSAHDLDQPAPAETATDQHDPSADARNHGRPTGRLAERPQEEEEPEPEFVPIPGRLAQGALRKNPALRLGLGLGVGLLVGFIASAPYAKRVERHVTALRADANVDRYRPFEEARQNAARLDAEADDRATNGALGVGALWLVVGAAATLGWYRLT